MSVRRIDEIDLRKDRDRDEEAGRIEEKGFGCEMWDMGCKSACGMRLDSQIFDYQWKSSICD